MAGASMARDRALGFTLRLSHDGLSVESESEKFLTCDRANIVMDAEDCGAGNVRHQGLQDRTRCLHKLRANLL